jgi:hypothetical protein
MASDSPFMGELAMDGMNPCIDQRRGMATSFDFKIFLKILFTES